MRGHRYRPGDRIASFTDRDYQEIVRRVQAAERTYAPPLYQSGQTVGLSEEEACHVLLSGTGTGGVYSGTESIPQPDGAWIAGSRTFAGNLREVNALTGLAGKRAWVIADGFGDYRFQHHRAGVSTLCPTISCSNCPGVNLPYSITINGFNANWTAGGGGGWNLSVSGLNKTVTGYPGSCGVSPSSFTFPVNATLNCPTTSNGPFVLTQSWRICNSKPEGRAAYTTATQGAFSTVSATSTGGNPCTPSGTYTFSDPDAPFSSLTVVAEEPTEPVSQAQFIANIFGCFGYRLPGATVAMTAPDGSLSSGITDSQGIVRLPIKMNGTYTGTISRTRFDTQPFTFNSFSCNNIVFGRTLAVSPGYYCYCGCPAPFPETLELIDPIYGAISLVYTLSVRTWTAARLSNLVLGKDKDTNCSVEMQLQCPIVYQLACDGGLNPRINVLFSECQQTIPIFQLPTLTNSPADVDFQGWPLSPSGASNFTDVHTCDPLDFTVYMNFANRGQLLYPGGPHAFHVFEAE